MATKRYSITPQAPSYNTVAAAGLAIVTAPIEVTIDWDGLIAAGLSGQQARLQAINGLKRIAEYIEQTDKFTVNA